MSIIVYDQYPKVLRALELISQGRTQTFACDEAGISIHAFEKATDNDTSLQRLRIEAERRGYDALADGLLTINVLRKPDGSDNPYAETNPQMAKVVSDNIKWVLDKRDRKRFGAHVEIKHEITADKAITDALDAARRRAATGKVVDLGPEDFASVPSQGLIGNVVSQVVFDELTDDEEIMRQLLG